LHGFENSLSLALEAACGRIEEIGVLNRGSVAEKKSLDVDRAIARGACKPLEAAGEVLRRGGLPATVTVAEA
jgi:hypothetical protein